uniref:Calcium-binding EF hand family protein n=1 Tax=Solanum tuberosum TaxID=4113 RepID=M0ZUQ0_SOLTU
YIASFSIGMRAGPWLIMSEVFPLHIKGLGGGLATLMNWFGSWIISYTFNFLMLWSSHDEEMRKASFRDSLHLTCCAPSIPHRRLILRSNFTFDLHPTHHEHISFDPLVAQIECQREDKEWEKQYIDHQLIHEPAPGQESQPEREDFMNAEDYLNDEHKFNVTDILFNSE